MAGPHRDTWIERLLGACASVPVVTTIAIVTVLGMQTLGFFLQSRPADFGQQYLLPLLSGTLLVTAIAAVLAVPLGILSAIYLSELAPRSVARVLRPALELLGAVPTVVYGYFALVLLTPWLQTLLPELPELNVLSAGLMVGLLVTPLISTRAQHALRSVPAQLREASHALGGSHMGTLLRVVLPTARRSIAAAVVHGLSRALGETMIVAIAAGRDPRLALDLTSPAQPLTGYLVETGAAAPTPGGLTYGSVFAVGATLFALTFAAHLLARWLTKPGAAP